MRDEELIRLWTAHATAFGGCDLPLLRAIAAAARAAGAAEEREACAGIIAKRAKEHDIAAIGLRECGHDGSEEHEAECYVAIELRSAERALRSRSQGQGGGE